MNRDRYYLYLSFKADWDVDWGSKSDKIEKLVGKPSSGSGMGMGWRDMDWDFDSEAQAREALLRVQAEYPDIKSMIELYKPE